MAKAAYVSNGSVFDFFSEPTFTLLSQSDSEALYSVVGDDGLIRKLHISGEDLTFKSGLLTGGVVNEVDFVGAKNVSLVEVNNLSISGGKLQGVLNAESDWLLLTKLFSGNDKISTSREDNDIFSGAGNDVVKSTSFGYTGFFDGPGADTYIGSTKNDGDNWVFYAHSEKYAGSGQTSGIVADLQKGKVVDPWGDIDTVKDIFVVIGSTKGDTIKGSGNSESFCGLDGDDKIDGGKGVDRIDYGPEQRFDGTHGVTVDLEKGKANDGFGGEDTLLNFENVRGSKFGDTLVGDAGSNQIEGNAGADTITGAGGDDVFRFRDGFGNDTITDFKIGSDKIQLNELSRLFDGYDSLKFAQKGDDTVISFEDEPGTIRLQHITATDLSESDFIL